MASASPPAPTLLHEAAGLVLPVPVVQSDSPSRTIAPYSSPPSAPSAPSSADTSFLRLRRRLRRCCNKNSSSATSNKVAPSADTKQLEKQVAEENEMFSVDADFDRESRERIKATMSLAQTYTSEEDGVIDEGLKLFAKKESGDTAMEPVKVRSPLLKDASAFTRREEGGDVYGYVRCVARGANVEDIIAYSFDWESRWFLTYERNPHVKDERTVAVVNAHNSVLYYRAVFPRPLQDRDFEVRTVWKRLGSGQCIMVSAPSCTTSPLPGVVRASNTRSMRLTQVGPSLVSVELVFAFNLGGIIPRAVTKAVALPASMSGLSRIQMYFFFVRKIEDFDEGGCDAEIAAQLLMDSLNTASDSSSYPDEKLRALMAFFARSAALRQLSSRYPWLAVLIWSIICKKPLPPLPPSSTSSPPLRSLTSSEAESIGATLPPILLSGETYSSRAALDAWLMAHPAMQQLADELPRFFLPFVTRLLQCLLDDFLDLTEEEIFEFSIEGATMNDKAFVEAIARSLTKSSKLLPKQRVQTCYRYNQSRLDSIFTAAPVLVPYFLAGMINPGISVASSSTYSNPLSSLSPKDAYLTGRSMSVDLVTELSSEAGVNAWFGKHRGARELAEMHPHFRTLSLAIARSHLMRAPWGMALRVYLGAFISLTDLATDIMTTERFFKEGNTTYAFASISMIAACLLMQIAVVWIQNKKMGAAKVLKESMLVVTFVKPAVDAYRVCKGEEPHPNEAFNVFYEMIGMKLTEMFFEAIPASILQSYAFLSSEKSSPLPLISIVSSIMSIAYTSSTLSLDYDCNPERRRVNPVFYGYVPDDSTRRLIVFSSMVLIAALHITLKVMGVALFAAVDPTAVVAVSAVDSLVFLLYKFSRGDFFYWINADGVTAVVVSFIARLMFKFVTDFTAIVHFRHPFELGGIYWCCNLVIGQGTSFFAAYLYDKSHSNFSRTAVAEGGGGFDSSSLWAVMAGLQVSFVIFFAIFLRAINQSYIYTFFTTLTGKKFAQNLFVIAPTDEGKFDIFQMHPSYYDDAGMREELRLYLSINWAQWMEEKPEWLTPHRLASIPEYLLPENTPQETKEIRRKSIEKRRGSILGLAGAG